MLERTCSIDGCERPVKARGWCNMHWLRWKRRGDVGAVDTERRPIASLGERRRRKAEQAQAYRERHPERVTAAATEYRAANREARMAQRKRWGAENAERIRAYRREYQEANREAINERKRRHRLANIEAERERQRRWNQANRRRKADLETIRRARKVNAPGDANPDQIAARVAYYGGRCWMCGAPYDHIDHVKPLAAGGSNWPANLRPACATCNTRKGDRWPFTGFVSAPIADTAER